MSKRAKKNVKRAGALTLRVRPMPPAPEVVQIGPVPDPGVRWRLAGRRLPEDVMRRGHPPIADYHMAADVEAWHKNVLRTEANDGRPPGIQKRLVCDQQGHLLVCLVRSPWGLVPIARATAGAFESRATDDGTPMALSQWPTGEHLPIASCACYKEVEVSIHEARSWVESLQDKAVYAG